MHLDRSWKKWGFVQSSLFWKTYLLNTFLVLIAFAICMLSARTILPSISQQDMKSMTEEIADRQAQQLSLVVDELFNLASEIQRDSSYRSDEPATLNSIIYQLEKSNFVVDDVMILNDKGTSVTVYPNAKQHVGLYYGYREYFYQPYVTKRPYLSHVFRSDHGLPVLVLGIPLLNDQQEVERVVALQARIAENQYTQSLFQAFQLGHGGYVSVVDNRGYFISHPDHRWVGINVSHHPTVQKLMSAKSGYEKVESSFESPMFVSYRYIPKLEWGILAQVPVESTYQSLQVFEQLVIKWALFLALPGMLLIAIFTQRMIQPIRQLHQAVDQVAQGNYEQDIEAVDQSEIGLLTLRFNEMMNNIRNKRLQLMQQQRFLRLIIDKNPSLIFTRNKEGKFTLANQSLAEIYQTTHESIIGKTPFEIYDTGLANRSLEDDQRVFASKKEMVFTEHLYIGPQREERYLQMVKIPILNELGEVDQVLSIGTDITELIRKEQTIEYQVYHDELTGLPNRTFLYQRIEEAVYQAREGHHSMALIFFDLDHFKHINDNLGHDVGDQLLQLVSQRLRQLVTPEGEVARMSGDEFCILLPEIHQAAEAEILAGQLNQLLEQPFQLQEIELNITASIGLCFYPQHGVEPQNLLKHAEIAMYEAKKKGTDYEWFTEEMSHQSLERLTIGSLLRKALSQNEFHLVYQPKQDLQSKEITGMEALLRWNSKDLGSISPVRFIPIAEETGFISSIGEWVLRVACQQNKRWQDQGYPSIRMAVNISARQLIEPLFTEKLMGILAETGLEPKWLELEITESTLIENAETAITTLKRLKTMGIHISIDDFGTGYSSLSYLKRFPVDTIKIDRSFIQEIETNEDDQAITRSIVAIAQSLNLKVIAEGVENKQQETLLMLEGCHEIQGYYLSRPLLAADMEQQWESWIKASVKV